MQQFATAAKGRGEVPLSIVVPTRNRPEYLRFALESLISQTNRDFEVIVSDNHTGRPCKEVFDRYSDARFRYVVPPSPLSMHDHWEFAVAQARGEFVSVLIDKTVLRPSAVAHFLKVRESHPADAYSWWSEGFELFDDAGGDPGPGRFVGLYRPTAPADVDCAAEIAERMSFSGRRGSEGKRYFHGKICFGAYSRTLLERIADRFGRVFTPIAPDYTSMIAALALAERIVDVGRPLLVSLNTKVSNGMLCATRSEMARKFLTEIDPDFAIVDTLPIPGLFTSVHNMVAHDYMRLAEAKGPLANAAAPRLDLANLALRAREDVAGVELWGEGDRAAQTAILERFVADRGLVLPEPVLRQGPLAGRLAALKNAVAAGISPQAFIRLAALRLSRRMPVLGPALERMTHYGSVIEAAAATDRA